jgi:hypothetical protein
MLISGVYDAQSTSLRSEEARVCYYPNNHYDCVIHEKQAEDRSDPQLYKSIPIFSGHQTSPDSSDQEEDAETDDDPEACVTEVPASEYLLSQQWLVRSQPSSLISIVSGPSRKGSMDPSFQSSDVVAHVVSPSLLPPHTNAAEHASLSSLRVQSSPPKGLPNPRPKSMTYDNVASSLV